MNKNKKMKKNLGKLVNGLKKLAVARPKKNPKKKSAKIDETNSLSECAAKYSLAIAEPFNPAARGVCIPSGTAVPSQKIMYFTRFSITIPSSGYGAVWFAPCLANNGYCAYYTTDLATDFGVTTKDYITATNISNGKVGVASFANAPFSLASLTLNTGFRSASNSVMGRVVAMGASLLCTTNRLNVGGTTLMFSSPNHENIPATYSYTDLLTQATCAEKLTDTSLSWIQCHPITDQEEDYNSESGSTAVINHTFPLSNADKAGTTGSAVTVTEGGVAYDQGAPIMCFMIHAPTISGSTQTFNVQVVQHVELAGKATAALQTPTHSDPQGSLAVRAAASQLGMLRAQNPKASLFSLLKRELKTVLSERSKRVVIGGLTKIADHYTGGAASVIASAFK